MIKFWGVKFRRKTPNNFSSYWGMGLLFSISPKNPSWWLKEEFKVYLSFCHMSFWAVADLRRRPEKPWPPLREEIAINKAHKLLLVGAKITGTTWKWPWTSTSEGAKIVGPPQKNSLDPLLIRLMGEMFYTNSMQISSKNTVLTFVFKQKLL